MTMLETERLTLRPWRMDDAADAQGPVHVCQQSGCGAGRGLASRIGSVAESAEIIRAVLSAPETYAVVLKRTDEPIGSIGLQKPCASVIGTPGYQTPALEIGYWIGKPYWGQGLIPEASRALMRHGFEDLDLQAIWGTHDVENVKSSRVMDKLGLRLVRVQPHVHMELLGDVWRDEAVPLHHPANSGRPESRMRWTEPMPRGHSSK